jgi:hypothetical protein
MEERHPWILTAPWYRWSQPGVPAAGRGSAPVLQKYSSPTLVAEFQKEPQKSLVYGDDDFVHRVEEKTPRPKFSLSSLQRVRTDRRKIFLDSHSRFYLVVVQVSCDQPGLPAVKGDKICQAGFVVRRKLAPAPAAGRPVLSAALDAVGKLEGKIAVLEGARPGRRRGRIEAAIGDHCGEEIAKLRVELEDRRQDLRKLAGDYGVRLEVQGWLPSPHGGFGEWREVAEEPEKIEESFFPLYPLVADPADLKHSAKGKTLYYGLLPTGSRDLDAAGNPRFDDRHLYEVRCFVRRRCACCAKGRCPDCQGEPVWSRPTEIYQLAPPMDLTGTSHRPMTVAMPDLPALEAQAAAMQVGAGGGLRLVSPKKSALKFKSDPDNVGKPGGATVGGPQICSFAIPLITIVASFVIGLFLPILVFAFGLWFMLKLKFCILPSFELDAGLAASLSATPPGVDISGSLEVGIQGAFGLNLGSEAATKLDNAYDVNALGTLALEMGSDYRDDAPPEIAADFPPKNPQYPAPRQPLPSLAAGLEYYPRVEMPT